MLKYLRKKVVSFVSNIKIRSLENFKGRVIKNDTAKCSLGCALKGQKWFEENIGVGIEFFFFL